jgi:AcrR family transcriptional regulator
MLLNSLLHTKEKIILEAINEIHDNGAHGLSTREIAKRVGISEPAIFKHFKTKSEIILAVLDHFSLYDNDVIQSIRTKNLSPLESLRSFIDIFGTYYENYPAITSVTLNLNLLQNDALCKEKVQQIQQNRIHFISELLEAAKALNEIKQEVDTEALSITIIGAIREWCHQWREKQYQFSLKNRMLTTVTMLLEAFRDEKEERK